MPRQQADLRVCASCEWIFKLSTLPEEKKGCGCPQCGFAHYSARYVLGNAAYRYAQTQKPWFDRKMTDYALKLQREIAAAAPARGPKSNPSRIKNLSALTSDAEL